MNYWLTYLRWKQSTELNNFDPNWLIIHEICYSERCEFFGWFFNAKFIAVESYKWKQGTKRFRAHQRNKSHLLDFWKLVANAKKFFFWSMTMSQNTRGSNFMCVKSNKLSNFGTLVDALIGQIIKSQ